jgi:hypothetical protein
MPRGATAILLFVSVDLAEAGDASRCHCDTSLRQCRSREPLFIFRVSTLITTSVCVHFLLLPEYLLEFDTLRVMLLVLMLTLLSGKVCGYSSKASARLGRRSFAVQVVTSAPTPGMTGRQSLTEQMKNMRESLAQDEQAQLLMQGLRGQNVNDDDRAVEGLQLKLVEDFGGGIDKLPLQYDPIILQAYFSSRPGAVAQRTWQLMTSFGGFMLRVAGDVLAKRVKEREVERAAELREIISSLGPFFIKLGQALSIRPDILSPRAMVELQRLCDKVR